MNFLEEYLIPERTLVLLVESDVYEVTVSDSFPEISLHFHYLPIIVFIGES